MTDQTHLQNLLYQLKNKLSFASASAARAAKEVMVGFPRAGNGHLPASVGFDLKRAANVFNEMSEMLGDIANKDLELKRKIREIARDLGIAYTLANGAPIPNRVSNACNQLENQLRQFRERLARHGITLR